MNLRTYKEFLSDTRSTKRILSNEVDNLSSTIKVLQKELEIHKEAREIVSAAGILAQENTKDLFESLVTQALQTIFGDEYSFKLESRFFRNQPEMEMFVIENGVPYSPKDEKGGAIVDVISFAARIVSWAMREPKPENVLLLDEPLRCLHKDALPFLAQLMQDISDELDLQIICITHEKELSSFSQRSERDRTFLVKKLNGISQVERIG